MHITCLFIQLIVPPYTFDRTQLILIPIPPVVLQWKFQCEKHEISITRYARQVITHRRRMSGHGCTIHINDKNQQSEYGNGLRATSFGADFNHQISAPSNFPISFQCVLFQGFLIDLQFLSGNLGSIFRQNQGLLHVIHHCISGSNNSGKNITGC